MMVSEQHIAQQLSDIPGDARVWIYACNRELTEDEVQLVIDTSAEFLKAWNTHGTAMRARVLVLYNRFLIVLADENHIKASGCSIDSSVRYVQSLESTLNVTFFDRMLVTYRNSGGEIGSLPMSEFQEKITQGEITADTVVFNNLVDRAELLFTDWEVPASKSWHARLFR